MKSTHLLVALSLFALTACGGQDASAPESEAAASGAATCEYRAQENVSFSAEDTFDVIEARAFGPDCHSVFVELTLRRADGKPLWIWGTVKPWLQQAPQSANDFDGAAAVQEFVNNLVKVRVDTTAQLPEWPQRETAFADSLGAFLSTPFQRDQYLDVRNRAAPRLCFASGIARSECVFYDAQAGEAVKVLESGE
jgi:hypothetical protein